MGPDFEKHGANVCANYCTWLHLVDGCEGSMRPPEHHTGAFARARVEMGTICPNMGVLEYCSGDKKGERDIQRGVCTWETTKVKSTSYDTTRDHESIHREAECWATVN